MDVKIVLVSVPFLNHLFSPPINLAYLKSYLQQNKSVEVKILDLELYYFRSHLINSDKDAYLIPLRYGEDYISKDIQNVLDEMVNLILSQRPHIIGFSVSHRNYIFTRYISQRIKEINPEIYIVYGGFYFCLRRPWLRYVSQWHRNLQDVDCIVKNEGELTLMELVKFFIKGKRPDYCKGTTIRLGSRIIDCGIRPLIKDIDSIPFPNFEDFSKQDYLADYIRILFLRGCTGSCAFCTDNYQMCVRLRSAQNIVDEIKLRIHQGYRRFQSCALSLNPSVSRLEEICKLIIRNDLNIMLEDGLIKHSSNLTHQTFSLLREAGFKRVFFGTESGSQFILDRMRKGYDIKTAEQNIKDAHSEGLKVVLVFVVGFPGETEKTLQETMNWIKANAKYISAVRHAVPLNVHWGSPIHDNIKLFDLDPSTLFQNPDKWETRDGSNNSSWRHDLAVKLQMCIFESGIPIMDFDRRDDFAAKAKDTSWIKLEVPSLRMALKKLRVSDEPRVEMLGNDQALS